MLAGVWKWFRINVLGADKSLSSSLYFCILFRQSVLRNSSHSNTQMDLRIQSVASGNGRWGSIYNNSFFEFLSSLFASICEIEIWLFFKLLRKVGRNEERNLLSFSFNRCGVVFVVVANLQLLKLLSINEWSHFQFTTTNNQWTKRNEMGKNERQSNTFGVNFDKYFRNRFHLSAQCTVRIVHTITFQYNRLSNGQKINYLFVYLYADDGNISNRKKKRKWPRIGYRVHWHYPESNLFIPFHFPHIFLGKTFTIHLFPFRWRRCPYSHIRSSSMFNATLLFILSVICDAAMGKSVIDTAEKVKKRLMIVLISNYAKENPFNHYDNGIKTILSTIFVVLFGMTAAHKMTQ